MGDSPKRWDTLVSHKPVCVKTLVPFWRFKILEVWIIPTSTVLCAALRKYKLGNVGEISYGILYYPHILYIYILSTSISENIFPPFSASELFNESRGAHWPIPSRSRPSFAPVSCGSSWRAQSRPQVTPLGNFRLCNRENPPLYLGNRSIIFSPFMDNVPLPCDGKSDVFYCK